MNARELTLNIAVNLGRLGRWAMEGRQGRIRQFLAETDDFMRQLEAAPKLARFLKTFESFKREFDVLKDTPSFDETWAETALTWAKAEVAGTMAKPNRAVRPTR